MGRIVMKQFNLEEYLKNPDKEVVTRGGRKVRVLCTDRKGGTPIIALVNGGLPDCKELCYSFFPDGKKYENCESDVDLFFVPTKHTDYINLYRNGGGYFLGGGVYTSEENAKYIANGDNKYIKTIKVEWEE